MAFLAKARKDELRTLAREMGEAVGEDMKIMDLKDLIINSKNYEKTFVQEMLTTIMEDRKTKEREENFAKEQERLAKEQERLDKEKEQERIAKEQERLRAEKEAERLEREKEAERLEREKEATRQYELEKLRLQLEAQKLSTQPGVNFPVVESENPKLEFKKLIPNFNPRSDDMSLYLNLFERQLKFLKIPEAKWVAYLIGVLPADVAKLIAREPEEKAQEYPHIKEVLLRRFKLTAERFRQLFCQHRKSPDSTWRDYFFELRSYHEGWISELDIKDFQQLKDLMVCDQLKRRTPPEVRDHYLDEWADWNNPSELADKLDQYENQRRDVKRDTSFKKKIHNSAKDEFSRPGPPKGTFTKNSEKSKATPYLEEKPPVTCFGCGKPGYIRSKCPDCSSDERITSNHIDAFASYTKGQRVALIDIKFCGRLGRVCADTGSSHSIAGERMYTVFKENHLPFKETKLTVNLADGTKSLVKCLTTRVKVEIKGKQVWTNFIILPGASGNRTLLGTDFLKSAGMVLDVGNRCWHFCNNPRYKFAFGEELDLPPRTQTPGRDQRIHVNACHLQEGKGKNPARKKNQYHNSFSRKEDRTFRPGGGTPTVERSMKTRSHLRTRRPENLQKNKMQNDSTPLIRNLKKCGRPQKIAMPSSSHLMQLSVEPLQKPKSPQETSPQGDSSSCSTNSRWNHYKKPNIPQKTFSPQSASRHSMQLRSSARPSPGASAAPLSGRRREQRGSL